MLRVALPSALRSREPLTNDEMRRVAPSIFAESAHESRSLRYTYLPTIDVLESLRKEGFSAFAVQQSRSRNANKRDFTKHMVRLRQPQQFGAAVGEEVNEVIIINSHDGTSAYKLMSGVFRVVCTNGLVNGKISGEMKIHHKGNMTDNVIDGVFRVVQEFESMDQHREDMKSILLDAGERQLFAEVALTLKYDTDVLPAPIAASQLLLPRRSDDQRSDVWTVFNVVQENVLRGGLCARTAGNARTRTREVTSIDQNVKLNRALWLLAEGMKKLKE